MISKLRKKFVIINMLLVSAVLLIVFVAICSSTYRQLQTETHNALRQALETKQNMEPPRFKIESKPNRGGESFWAIPVFCVILKEDGHMVVTMQKNVSVENAALVEAVDTASQSGQKEGIIREMNLRYMVSKTEVEQKIAFADMSNEITTMKNLLLNSLIVGTGGLIAFFFISLFLSRWALRPVEKTWQQQRQFVADASHELKTPLTVILANMDILQSHRKDTLENQEKWVENTQSEAIRMKKLIDNMLYLAKSDDGEAPMVLSSVNVSDVIWNAALTFEAVAFEKGVTINTEIQSDIYVNGHEGSLNQLCAILLDNGCKYAGKNGEVTVSLAQEQGQAILKVHNTGSAIPEEDLAHVFERFYRADKSRQREQGGYGLGLAIAKSIVDRYNDKITVESTEERGTTFIVRYNRNPFPAPLGLLPKSKK